MSDCLPFFIPHINFQSNYNGSWLFFFTTVKRRMSEKSQVVIQSLLAHFAFRWPWSVGEKRTEGDLPGLVPIHAHGVCVYTVISKFK